MPAASLAHFGASRLRLFTVLGFPKWSLTPGSPTGSTVTVEHQRGDVPAASLVLGFDDVTLYDGSMGEWAKDEGLSIEAE